MRDVYAVVDEYGVLEDVATSQERAIRAAERLRPNGIYLDARATDRRQLRRNAAQDVNYALKMLGPLQRVNWAQVEAFGWNKDGLKKAFERVREYFPGKKYEKVGGSDASPVYGVRKVAAQQEAKKLALSLLGQNYKTSKTGAKALGGVTVNAQGLSLLPHRLWYDAIGSQSEYEASNGKRRKIPTVSFCAGSSQECRDACLVYSGQNTADLYNGVVKLSRSNALMAEPEAFVRLLTEACVAHVEEVSCTVNLIRLNVFSDIPWEVICPEMLEYVAEKYERARYQSLERQRVDVAAPFYDYTKVSGREMLPHYDLTFSYSGVNLRETLKELQAGRRAAIVFVDLQSKTRKPKKLPTSVRLNGQEFRVVDGDVHDARPFDPEGVIVGLKYKSPKKAGEKIRHDVSHEAGFQEAYGDLYQGFKRTRGIIEKPEFVEEDSKFLWPKDQRSRSLPQKKPKLKKNAGRDVFIIPAQETDDGHIITSLIPRQQPGVVDNERQDLLTESEVESTFGADAIIETIDEEQF